MKFVFLDIDGVIKPFTHPYGETFSKPHVERVEKLVHTTDAKIVLSTAWRAHHSMSDMRRWLAQHGLNPFRIVGATPVLDRQTRGAEIAAWLRANLKPSQTARVAVLDDNDRGRFDMHPMRTHLVLTHPDHGLTHADQRVAHRLLTHGPVWRNPIVHPQYREEQVS